MNFIDRVITALTELHPPHVMFVHFPVALTGVGLLFILLALWRRSQMFEQAAFLNITLAAASSVIAGLTGYRDHLVRFEGDAPYVQYKIAFGITLFVLTTITAVSRRRNPEILWRPSTRVLYAAAFAGSFALAVTLAFLGGAILYGF